LIGGGGLDEGSLNATAPALGNMQRIPSTDRVINGGPLVS